jgi:hypothetical protein
VLALELRLAMVLVRMELALVCCVAGAAVDVVRC